MFSFLLVSLILLSNIVSDISRVQGGLELIPLNLTRRSPLFNDIQLKKSTHHHLVGYFQSYDVPLYIGPPPINLLHYYSDINISLSSDKIVNWSFDGKDFIASPQYYISHWDIHRGDIIYLNCSLSVPPTNCSFPTVTTCNSGSRWPIFTGFNTDTIQLSDVSEVFVKDRDATTPIYYAGLGFRNKTALVNYLDSIEFNRPTIPRTVTIIKSLSGTQIILHENGRNIVNYHLREAGID